MSKLVLLFSLCLYWNTISAQSTISSKKITIDQIPETIKFRGKLIEAWKWKDNLGDNILITSAVPSYKAKSFTGEEEAYSTELHAFHFVKKDTTYKLLWKISDGVKGCPFDITAEFIKDAIKISDLDKNGIAETTIQYKLACRSDATPAQMKLIMHEDTIKYALRGSMWLAVSEEMKFNVTDQNVNLETWKDYRGTDDEWEKLYGRYQSEKDFLPAPVSFLNFARHQWLRFVKESFD
ncbi:MAG TPA: hypothetical protein VJU78_16095 [Chitinophagaceae bacterium]|nr:hypothetical protein [Chitinophagaceae bacterium]